MLLALFPIWDTKINFKASTLRNHQFISIRSDKFESEAVGPTESLLRHVFSSAASFANLLSMVLLKHGSVLLPTTIYCSDPTICNF